LPLYQFGDACPREPCDNRIVPEVPYQSTGQIELVAYEPRIRWLFAGLLVFSVFAIGVAGLGLMGFGPCTVSNPWVLFFSGSLSLAAIYSSVRVLTRRQRKVRLRSAPFYFALLVAILFASLQLFLLFMFVVHGT